MLYVDLVWYWMNSELGVIIKLVLEIQWVDNNNSSKMDFLLVDIYHLEKIKV